MKFTILVAVFFAFVVSFTSATGVLHTDEITGYSSPTVNIPNFETDHSATTFLSVGSFQAVREEGFNLATVGGINFNSDEGVTVSTPGKLSLKASVGGDVSLRGETVDIKAAQDIILVGSGESIISVKDDINFAVDYPGNGTLSFNSNLRTEVAAVNSLILSSSVGDVRLVAENGVVTLHADSLGLVGGVHNDEENDVYFQSFTDILVKADREYDLLAHSDLHVSAHSKLVIDATLGNIEFESAEYLYLNASSNIYFSASEKLTLETLLGDLSIDADLGISFHAKGIEHLANYAYITADTFEVAGSGSFNLFSNKDNTFFGANTFWYAADAINFIGKSDANIAMSLIEVDQFSSEIIVQAANLKNSAVQFQAGTLTFQTFNDDIHFKSDELTFNGNIIRFSAIDDFNLSSKIDAFTPANTINAEEGTFSIDSGLRTTFAALGDVNFNSNYILNVVDLVSVSLSAIDTVYFNGIFETNIFTKDLSVTGSLATTIAAGNDVYTISDSFRVNSAKDLTVQTTFDGSFTWDNGNINTLNPVATTINTNGFSLNVNAHKNLKIEGDNLVGITTTQEVEFNSSADDNSFTGFSIKNDMIVSSPAGSITNDADQILTFAIPSGGATFSAGRSVNFNSLDDYLTSVTDSIYFKQGQLSAQSDSGIYFRAGNALDFDAASHAITFTSSSVLIDSATSVAAFADQLVVRSSQDSVTFKADNAVTFDSLADLNLSPKPNGDIDINGGQVIFANPTFTANFKTQDVHSGDENNILFDSSEYTFSSSTNVLVNSNYANLNSENNLLIQAGGQLNIKTTKEDIVFDQTQTDLDFTIDAAKDATFVSDYLYLETVTYGTDITYTSGGPASINANTNIAFEADESIQFTTPAAFTVTTGGDFDVQMIPNNQEFVSAITITGDTLFKTCQDDIRFFLSEYTGTVTGDLTLHQLPNSCSVDRTLDFNIITHSDDLQTIQSIDQFYYGDEHLIVAGGRVYVTSHASSFKLTSDTEIIINSVNGDDHLADTDDDRLWSGKNIYIDTDSVVSFTTVGFPDIAQSEFYERGLEFDTNSGLLNFTVPTDGYNVTAPQGLIQIVSGFADDIIIWDTHDLIMEGGLGSVVIQSGGNNHNDTVELDSSVQFFAAIGNILIETDNADIHFESSQIFVSESFDPRRGESYDSGLVVESFLGAITYTAGGSIDHSSSEMDGDFIYQTLTGKIDVTIRDDILLRSGDLLYDGSIDFTAARNYEVTTQFEQKFITTGPNKQPSQTSILLFGEEGPILFTTPADQQFFISGSSLFDAATGLITIDAVADVTLDSQSDLYLFSMFDSTIDSLAGNITLSAHGGGGSVDILSDSAQSITGTASNSLLVYSEDSTSIISNTGIVIITKFNDFLLNQFGNYQGTNVHSGGTIVFEAERQDGVAFSSNNNINFLAQKDVLFDATQLVSIGSTGKANTATEPIISFNAGNTGSYGLDFDVTGGIDWTTLKNGAISFDSYRASWTSAGRQDFTSNGPVLFKVTGLFDLPSFEVDTNSLFSLLAGGTTELVSNTTVVLTATNSISFTATGGQTSDTSFIKVDNKWVINAVDHLNFNTGAYESVLLDWSVTAGNLISFSNTVGDGGSLSFVSDWFLRTLSQGPISVQSNDLFNVYTDGLDSDIIFKSSDDQVITSGSSISTASRTIDFDSPNSVSITTTDGDIEFVASGTTFVTSNGTSSYSAVDSVTIQAGYANTLFDDLKSFLNITSRGDLVATARQAVEFEVRETGEDLSVIADKDIQLQNSIPTRPSDQGDILVTTAGYYYFSSGDDSTITAGRDIYYETDNYELRSVGTQKYLATGATADIWLETADDLFALGAHDLNLAAFTSITYDVDDNVSLDQVEENAPGAISFRTLGADAPLTVTTTEDDVDMYALGFFLANTDGYININADSGDLTTDAYGADITLQNKGTGGLFISALDFDYTTNNLVNGNIFINAFGTPGEGTPDFSLKVRADDINVNNDSGRGSVDFIAEDIQLHNPKTTANIDVLADFSIHVRSTGVEEDRFERPYGILIETDDTIAINSNRDNTNVNSNQGRVFVVASEDLTFSAGAQISGYAGDKLLISTGFTVEPNFQIPFRTGILFDGTTRSSYRANRGDIVFDSEDASWSATSFFNVRSEGNAVFTNEQSDTTYTTASVSFNANNILFRINDEFVIDAATSVNFVARESIEINADTNFRLGVTNGDLTVAADNIVFLNSNGRGGAGVNGGVKPSVVINAPVFRIPSTRNLAGISRITVNNLPESDKFRPDEENNWPTCEDREFTIDSQTGSICYCNYHKWRCNNDDPRP